MSPEAWFERDAWSELGEHGNWATHMDDILNAAERAAARLYES
jgi:hypothetical protein